jgi:hypothetical protein
VYTCILNAIQTETPNISNENRVKLIDYFEFYAPLKNFHLYGDVTINDEGLQKVGLCSAVMAFEQGGIFIVPHLL